MSARNNPGPAWYVGATLAGLAVVALWLSLSGGRRDPAPLPKIAGVPPFRLINESAAPVDETLFHDRISVVDFIFTSCAGICPMMSGRMAWLQEELRDREGVQLVSFSVDPETDTPEVLTAYGKRYGAIRGRWTFLTGDRATIYSVSKEGFRLGLEAEGDDAIIHSPKFVLVDGQGTIRGYYDSDSTGAMENLVGDVRRLAGEPGQ